MSLQYRRSRTIAPGTRLNLSKTGVSVSKRVGPLTLNSRGRGSLRIAPGLSYRFGRRRKNDSTGALIMLAVALIIMLIEGAIIILRVLIPILIWLLRWAWFGTVALTEHVRTRRANS